MSRSLNQSPTRTRGWLWILAAVLVIGVPAGVFVARQFRAAADVEGSRTETSTSQTAAGTSSVPAQPLPGHSHLLDTGVAAVVEERLKENSSVELSSFA